MKNFIDGMLAFIARKEKERNEVKAQYEQLAEKLNKLDAELDNLNKTLDIIGSEDKPKLTEQPKVKSVIISDCTDEKNDADKRKGQYEFYKLICYYKEKNGLSNIQLSQIVEISAQAVGRWANGAGLPQYGQLEEIYKKMNSYYSIDRVEFFNTYNYSKAHRK